MKATPCVLALLLAGTAALSGCGKSTEQKKMESDLNAQIMQGHEAQMAKARQVDELLARVDTAIAISDSLIKAYPRGMEGHTSSDLIAARDKLQGSRNALESWMQAHEPYNEGIKHDQAMAQLNGDLDALTQVSEQMDSAIIDATKAIDSHKTFLSTIAAPGTPVRRK
jgi:hypothetical protein